MKLFWQGGKCRTLPNIGEANVGGGGQMSGGQMSGGQIIWCAVPCGLYGRPQKMPKRPPNGERVAERRPHGKKSSQ